VSRSKKSELRDDFPEEEAKKNIWPQVRGGNRKLKKIFKDLLNCISGQLLLG
jgi:hypothetical protein